MRARKVSRPFLAGLRDTRFNRGRTGSRIRILFLRTRGSAESNVRSCRCAQRDKALSRHPTRSRSLAMSVPVAAARSGRMGWFADRPVGMKIGAALVLLAVVGASADRARRRPDQRARATPPSGSTPRASSRWSGSARRSAPSRAPAPATRLRVADEATRTAVRRGDRRAPGAVRRGGGGLRGHARRTRPTSRPCRTAIDAYDAFVDEQLIPVVDAGDATAAAELAAGPLPSWAPAVTDAFGAEQARQGADAQRTPTRPGRRSRRPP